MTDSPGQLSLEGFAPEPAGRDRLFLAVLPDEAAIAGAGAIAATLRQAASDTLVRPMHRHVTLHHLGDHHGVPAPVVAMASRAAQAAAAEIAPFELCLDRLERFDRRAGKAPTVLTASGAAAAVRALHSRLGAALKAEGLGQWWNTQFTPHMTLLWGRQALAARAVEPVAWWVRELVLVHSTLGETRHETLGRWPLRG
jgi:RNA 2',3'-cyclic 3'-phosphodiesterase